MLDVESPTRPVSYVIEVPETILDQTFADIISAYSAFYGPMGGIAFGDLDEDRGKIYLSIHVWNAEALKLFFERYITGAKVDYTFDD